jgi:hypothetical protein
MRRAAGEAYAAGGGAGRCVGAGHRPRLSAGPVGVLGGWLRMARAGTVAERVWSLPSRDRWCPGAFCARAGPQRPRDPACACRPDTVWPGDLRWAAVTQARPPGTQRLRPRLAPAWAGACRRTSPGGGHRAAWRSTSSTNSCSRNADAATPRPYTPYVALQAAASGDNSRHANSPATLVSPHPLTKLVRRQTEHDPVSPRQIKKTLGLQEPNHHGLPGQNLSAWHADVHPPFQVEFHSEGPASFNPLWALNQWIIIQS